MNLVLLFGVVTLFASSSTAIRFRSTTPLPSPTPSPDFECPDREEGYYAHPTDCTAYYHCSNGLAWYQQCDAGLYFNKKSKMCDWPWNVECEAEEPTEDPQVRGVSIIGPDPDYECDPEENGAFPHEEFCEYYVDCYKGLATLAVCTDTMLFDLVYNGCNYASEVHCGNRTRPEGYPTPKPTTTKDPSITERPPYNCPEPDGLFPDPEDCAAYYTCAGGYGWHNVCSFSLFFNTKLKVCDYLPNVDCGDRPIHTLEMDETVIQLIKNQNNDLVNL